MKRKLSATLKAQLVLVGIIFSGFALIVCVGLIKEFGKPNVPAQRSTTEKPAQKPVQPASSAVYRHDIQLSDLNIGKDFLLCEGSQNECRQVFEDYSKIISKEYGLPGATLHGDLDNPMDKGSITSGWILGNGYEIILSLKHANQYWKARGEKPKTTISMLKF